MHKNRGNPDITRGPILGEAQMLSTMLRSLIAPRNPRRYVGRHRARFTIQIISRNSSISTVSAQVAESTAEQSAA